MPLAVEAWSLTHWTAREVPVSIVSKEKQKTKNSHDLEGEVQNFEDWCYLTLTLTIRSDQSLSRVRLFASRVRLFATP